MNRLKTWIQKYWRACLFIAALLATLIIAIFGWHWTDLAKKPFWWTFWVIAAVLAVPGFVGLISWFNNTRNKW
jgi:phosphoglycerol transferase MdoB-like AlkP superfamily enzyme